MVSIAVYSFIRWIFVDREVAQAKKRTEKQWGLIYPLNLGTRRGYFLLRIFSGLQKCKPISVRMMNHPITWIIIERFLNLYHSNPLSHN
jgi:hypothetical protein